MDVITIFVTGKLTHSRPKLLRTIVSASIGATSSVVLTVANINRPFSLIIGCIISILMCAIAFKVQNCTALMRKAIVLWTSGYLFGGIISSLLSVGYSIPRGSVKSTGHVVTLIPLGCVIILIIIAVLTRVTNQKMTDVTLIFRGKQELLKGLIDSGNLLEDPFSGDAVIIVYLNRLKRILSSEEYEYFFNDANELPASLHNKIRLIPAFGISGNTLLKAIRIDSVLINTKNCKAVIAIVPEESKNRGFDCIVPSKIL